MKKKYLPYILMFILLLPFLFCFAEEQVTVTTYFPAPYVVYNELRVNSMAVGSSYRNAILGNGDFVVSDRVGINTTSPSSNFELGTNISTNLCVAIFYGPIDNPPIRSCPAGYYITYPNGTIPSDLFSITSHFMCCKFCLDTALGGSADKQGDGICG